MTRTNAVLFLVRRPRARLQGWLALGLTALWGLSLGCSKPERREPRAASSSVAPLRASSSGAAPRASEAPAGALAQDVFGTLDGQVIQRFTLKNAHGLTARVITYGATLTELHVPDRSGKLADVVLGYDDLADYRTKGGYFGAIVGRVANRIRGARFELNGAEYTLTANERGNHLHGGRTGWDKVVWSAEDVSRAGSAALRLRYVSKDGEEGYPGNVTASVTYELNDRDELVVDMRARTDRTTLVNLAQHSYFNLAGAAAGSVAEQELELYADAYTPGDPQIPDGRVLPVRGTPFDFTTPKALGKDLAATGIQPSGFDHNFVVRGDPRALRPVARLVDPGSGRVMTLEADQPGVQLYTANHLKGDIDAKGARLPRHAGVCLETQAFPDAIHVPAWRDQVILPPEREYQHVMRYRFSTQPSAGAR